MVITKLQDISSTLLFQQQTSPVPVTVVIDVRGIRAFFYWVRLTEAKISGYSFTSNGELITLNFKSAERGWGRQSAPHALVLPERRPGDMLHSTLPFQSDRLVCWQVGGATGSVRVFSRRPRFLAGPTQPGERPSFLNQCRWCALEKAASHLADGHPNAFIGSGSVAPPVRDNRYAFKTPNTLHGEPGRGLACLLQTSIRRQATTIPCATKK